MERGASLRGSLNGFSLRAALGEVADGSLGDHSIQDTTFNSKMHESTRGYVAPHRVSSWVNVVFLLFSELVGTGIMALPWALAKLGWVIGLVLILIVALLCLYSGILLWRLHLAYPYGITYGNLAEAVCGGGGSPVSGPVMRNIVFCVGENSTCSAAGRDRGLT